MYILVNGFFFLFEPALFIALMSSRLTTSFFLRKSVNAETFSMHSSSLLVSIVVVTDSDEIKQIKADAKEMVYSVIDNKFEVIPMKAVMRRMAMPRIAVIFVCDVY